MKKYQIPRIEPKEYNKMIRYLKTLPDYKRNIAEKKLYLIKSYEALARKEIRRQEKKFKKEKSIKGFCERNGINVRTFYGYITQYEKQGLDGFIPHGWGHNKGKGEYSFLLPQIQEYYQYGKITSASVFRKLREYCVDLGLSYPCQSTVHRMIKRKNLIKSRKKRKKSKKTKHNFQKLTPDYIKIVDKKSFNIAMYKYGLVLPFLNPELSDEDRVILQHKICDRVHHPFPGVTFKIKKSTLNKYILFARRQGIDGLIPNHCFKKTRKCKNEITTQITIKLDKPWESIKQLETVIETLKTPFEWQKNVTLDLLKKVSTYSYRYEHKPFLLRFEIEPKILNELKELKHSTHRNISTKATAILMAHRHFSLREISMAINRPVRTIQGWFIQFKKRGIPYIKGERDYTKQNIERRNRQNWVVSILHHSPNHFGLNRSAWILDDIAKIYHRKYGVLFSRSTISRTIKKTDYSWKRAKRVLTSPDPKYKEKTKKVLNTLRNLGTNDCFFFIDEAGPWQVKKYGGKSLTLKGTTKIIPQFQAAKGRVSFIGALDALKNQVTYIFIKSKNTMAVITLIKILYFKYHTYSTLNLTWDCASWHKSKELKGFLKELKKWKGGPVINIVPLPKRAQFLNVIESVFGGLKRAVVFNSNYQNEFEMKMAIVRHFKERNKFYQKNPKRAGNKIWDRESYDLGEFEGGVYKKQM